MYPLRFKHNNYTRRDGRNIGAPPWFTAFSDWTRHLWKPYENPTKYLSEINLIHKEKNFGYKPEHILTDYLVSRNIAKYGLKVKTVLHDMFASYHKDGYPLFFIHQHSISQEEKVECLKHWDNIIQNEINSIDSKLKLKNNFNYS